MGTKALAAPPAMLSTGPLTTVTLDPSKLYRIGTHTTGEPYFQHSGASRFDAPGAKLIPPAPEYDSCYFGLSLDVALAETMLHDLSPMNGRLKFHRPVSMPSTCCASRARLWCWPTSLALHSSGSTVTRISRVTTLCMP